MDMRTCALVATCDFNAADFARRRAAGLFDAVVAIDGGLSHLQAAGCAPDVMLGDFDSLGYVPEGDNVVRHPTRKDQSDLDLALDYALGEGFVAMVVYGALGGRLDHTLAALSACARAAEAGADVLLVGRDICVKVLVGPGDYTIPHPAASPGGAGTVSVFSATDVSRGVTERGLSYPLSNHELTNRTTLGLSNELTGQEATIHVENGTLLIVHPA